MFQQACQLQTSVMAVLPPPSPSNATISFPKTNPFSPHTQIQPIISSKPFSLSIPTALHHPQLPKTSFQKQCSESIDFDFPLLQNPKLVSSLVGSGLAIALVASTVDGGAAFAAELPYLGSFLQLSEPQNALSLPTWAIHVSSVVEWITAMVLVWQYGERSGYESWKGLSWGMVPLLGGAFCACTWHFFYNSESLEVLVALQAALTVIGNFTMCIAAFRIYKSSQGGSENL